MSFMVIVRTLDKKKFIIHNSKFTIHNYDYLFWVLWKENPKHNISNKE